MNASEREKMRAEIARERYDVLRQRLDVAESADIAVFEADALLAALSSPQAGAGQDVPNRFVWINADRSENRLGLLFDCELANPILEGANGGFIYGSVETGRTLIEVLNQANRARAARSGE